MTVFEGLAWRRFEKTDNLFKVICVFIVFFRDFKDELRQITVSCVYLKRKLNLYDNKANYACFGYFRNVAMLYQFLNMIVTVDDRRQPLYISILVGVSSWFAFHFRWRCEHLRNSLSLLHHGGVPPSLHSPAVR